MKANQAMNASPIEDWNCNKLSHAYIASGNLADTLAMVAVCCGNGKRPCMECVQCKKSLRGIHPDIIVVSKPEKNKEILVEQIRELKTDVVVVPNESERKAYVVNDADLMNVSAQNAFLRMLEEPPSHVVFILKTNSPAGLLSTVRSRCVELKSNIEETEPDPAVTEITDDFFDALLNGDLPLVRIMFRLEKLERERFAEFLTAAREQAATGLISAADEEKRGKREEGSGKRCMENMKILSNVERVLVKAGEYLDLNVSAGHISGMICASLIN